MWLLKRFLYKPVLNAIDEREKRIADLLKETKQHELQVEQQQSELIVKNSEFALERESLLVQAKAEAAELKQQLLEKASIDAEQQHSQWLSSLQKEQLNLGHDITQRAQQEVIQVARKALQDLSSVELETQICQIFIKQLIQLSSTQIEQYTSSAKGRLVVRSAMPLNDDNMSALKKSITSIFSVQSSLCFEVDASLISGIELVGNGHKLSWNINDYLSNLEDSIAGVIDSKIAQSNRQTRGKGE
jgi:F-type H+-transporting ATPase subunit b